MTPLMTHNVNYSKMMTNMDDIKTVEMKPTKESLSRETRPNSRKQSLKKRMKTKMMVGSASKARK